MPKHNDRKLKTSDAARARHFRIYERYLVQRAVGDKFKTISTEFSKGGQVSPSRKWTKISRLRVDRRLLERHGFMQLRLVFEADQLQP